MDDVNGGIWLSKDKHDKLTGENNRKFQPLPPEAMQALAEWKGENNPASTDAVVDISRRLLDQLYDDLAAIGEARMVDGKWDTRDAEGHVLCLHALRHTYCSWLGQSGADIKTCMELMRHANEKMTLRYMHTNRQRLTNAAAKLPTLKPAAQNQTAAAAGA